MSLDQNRPPREPWHLDRRVPIALIVTILMQTASVVWFLAQMDSRVAILERDEARIEVVARANSKAINSLTTRMAVQQEKLSAILSTVERIDRRLADAERKTR